MLYTEGLNIFGFPNPYYFNNKHKLVVNSHAYCSHVHTVFALPHSQHFPQDPLIHQMMQLCSMHSHTHILKHTHDLGAAPNTTLFYNNIMHTYTVLGNCD